MKITLCNLQNKLPVHTGKLKKLILKVLKGERVKKGGWINVCLVDDSQIRKHNAKFHKTRSSTDVLAFNLSEQKQSIILADIMISTQTAIKQARLFKTSPDQELSLYVVHGVLHILGFNDQSPRQTQLMRKKENQYVH